MTTGMTLKIVLETMAAIKVAFFPNFATNFGTNGKQITKIGIVARLIIDITSVLA